MKSTEGTLQIYLNDIKKHSLIDYEKEKQLAKKARSGDKEALKELVNANLRFVIHVAKKYRNTGISLTDIISAGNMGLIKAAERYDERFDARFLSYAKWWIKRYINRLIDAQIKSFRIPSTRAREILKVKQTREEISRKKGSEPTIEEIAKKVEYSPKKIKENINLSKRDVSLDQLIDKDEDLEFKEIISEDIKDFPDEYDHECLVNKILEKLKGMDSRSKKIIFYYFGLNKNNPHTLEEIGDMMHISRERVRQLRNKALKDIKVSLRGQGIRVPETVKTEYSKENK